MKKRQIPAKTAKDERRDVRMLALRWELVDAVLAENFDQADLIGIQIDNLELNRKKRLVVAAMSKKEATI